MSFEIRPERPDECTAIDAVLRAAFPAAAEADLVKRLRIDSDLALSLVAEDGGAIIGHIGFVPIKLEPDPGYRLWGLAPLSVIPSRQRQGIGSALVRRGIEGAMAREVSLMLVLGDPAYYGRFSFIAETAAAIDVAWAGPHFMGLAFRNLPRPRGRAFYPLAFAALGA